MISITSQPDTKYFHWQNLVQFKNLKDLNLLDNHRSVWLVQHGTPVSDWLSAFKKQFPDNVFIYTDDRPHRHYIPTIKIHGIYRYLLDHPEDDNKDMFLFDSDVLFKEPIDIGLFVKPYTAYCSDTVSYIGWQYLKTKGHEIVHDMAKFMGIGLDDIIRNNDVSGGAQIYYRGIPNKVDYFKEIDELAPQLFDLMRNHPTYNDYTPTIQDWTAEMWAVLWLLWKRNVKTEISKELDFTWATDSITRWESAKMLHMAGVTNQDKGKFYKGAYVGVAPFGQSFNDIDPNSISSKYVEYIIATQSDPEFAHLAR